MVKKHRIHSQSKLSDEASASHKLGAQKSATGPKTQHPSRLTWEMDAQRAGRGKAGQESEWEGEGESALSCRGSKSLCAENLRTGGEAWGREGEMRCNKP